MTPGERFVVLGLAQARSPWFRSVATWAHDGSLPLEFIKCVSSDEVVARLRSSRPFSALLIDASLPALDRDVIAIADRAACAVLVVDDQRVTRDWIALGAAAVLSSALERDELLAALADHALSVGRVDAGVPDEDPVDDPRTALVAAVTGPGGAGASTVAMALAQGAAADARLPGDVLLADFCLHAEQAMLHDARDVVPGVQDLVEAYRAGHPGLEEVRGLAFDVPARGYHLLLGLRRSRFWPTLRPRALEAAIDGLCRAWGVVVFDTDPDVEGEDEGGSADVEERHGLARSAVARADLVYAVGHPGLKGLHSLVRVVHDLHEAGVSATAILPVVNGAPRHARTRATIHATFHALASVALEGAELAGPLFLAERRVDEALRDGVALPAALAEPLAGSLRAMTARRRGLAAREPVAVRPGALGSWTEPLAG